MPFTPVHLGPGLAFKAIGGRHFSFMVFGGSQVLMDIEPLVGIVLDNPVLHGPSHTLLGATVIGLLAAGIGKPIATMALDLLKIVHDPITWRAAVAGAFVGTYSHVFFDGIMHADMSPWWPFAAGNPLLGAISIDQLHDACFLAGAIGLGAIAIRALSSRRAQGKRP